MKLALLSLGLALIVWPQTPTTLDGRVVERLAALPTNAARRAVVDAEHIALTPTLLEAFNDRGRAFIDKQDFDHAQEWHQLALDCAEQAHDVHAVAAALRLLSDVARQRNDYEQALDFQRRSLERARQGGDAALIASGLANLGAILRRLGDDAGALSTGREALALAEALGAPDVLAAAHTSLAAALAQVGDFRASLEHDHRALAINRELGAPGAIAIAICNTGESYQSQRDFSVAIDAFQRCIPMAESAGYRITQARFTGNLANVYFEMGNTRLARQEGERALSLARVLNHREIIAGALSTLAAVAWREGRRADAIATLEESVKILDEIKNKDILTSLLPTLGRYQFEGGQAEQGLATLERARAEARRTGDRVSLYYAGSEAGKALRARGQMSAARLSFEEAIQAVEGVRGDVAGTNAQERFFSDKGDPYREMVAMTAEAGAPDEAFRFAERGRMQALLEVLRGGRVSVTKAMTSEERAAESRLRQEAAALNLALAGARQRGAPTRDFEARLEKSRVGYADFERVLYAAHPELQRDRLDVSAAGVAEAAALLPDARTALVEYVVAGDATFVIVITKEASPRLVRLPVTAEQLTTQVQRFAQQVANRALDYKAGARDLERTLIAPVSDALKGRTRLVIVPDGPLWRLPFAALESAGGITLLERFTLFYAPSATVLREVTARHAPRPLRTLLAVGNPPGAGLDSVDLGFEAMSDLYGRRNARILTGAAASETAFKASAGRYDVLHLASHGVLDNDNPLYSHIALAKTGADDGFLEAREMSELDLHAELVILSACETARGRFSGGEGLIGMTWALFLAGSPATIASGWKVDEEATSKMMVALHKQLRAGESRAVALRSAALAVRADERYRHPYYWAAFSLSGNGF